MTAPFRRTCFRRNSASDAESIITVTQRRRMAQFDNPVHKHKDSILSLSSGFQNFSGIINWASLLLFLGGTRLFLENLNKYGIIVNPRVWITPILEFNSVGKIFSHPLFHFFIFANFVILTTLTLELGISRYYISSHTVLKLHIINLIILLLWPILYPWWIGINVGPISSMIVTTAYSIIFFKMISYIQVNEWCRSKSSRRVTDRKNSFINGTQNGRHRSLSNVEQKNLIIKNVTLYGGDTDISLKTSKEFDDNILRHDTSSIIEWPSNLTIKDMYYFICIPTLCYELNFPRMNRIRKMFLFRRAMEVIVGSSLIVFLFQQWIIPCVANSLLPFSNMHISLATERLLKMAIPNNLLWLTWFYLLFHSLFNALGEIFQFADRTFYLDWWNSHNIVQFWKSWNVPVHRWCSRHLYKPMLKAGFSPIVSMLAVFLISAIFHEYLVSVPLRVFKIYAFMGMLAQLPLIYISNYLEKRFGPRIGNIVVWLSIIIGQPLAVMMYYHDYVLENYEAELLISLTKIS